ncbi:MAG TPA: TerC family protein [Bryobacteraceae bacterium]|jgi:YjbE family integral membrane protein|nr:TerC family protein [Bryobacteraceae bacterium]
MPTGSLSRLLVDCLTIVLIDLLLAGDNALVIAVAVRSLPQSQRRTAIGLGAGAAVVLRVAITIAAARLLGVEFVKLAGGIFVIWLAVKVLADASGPPAVEAAHGFLKAIWFIVFADITMSIDNVLAVAGAARGSIPLIVFGLGVSIPFVVFSSNLIAAMMDRYPLTLFAGSALLGKVGAEMMITDPYVVRTLHPSQAAGYWTEGLAICGVLIAGWYLSKRRRIKSTG